MTVTYSLADSFIGTAGKNHFSACDLCGAIVSSGGEGLDSETTHTKWHADEDTRMQRWFDRYTEMRARYSAGTL